MNIAFALAYITFLVVLATEGHCTNIVSKVDRWRWYPQEMDVKSMSDTEKKEAIAEMRRRLPISDSTDRSRYRSILIRSFSDEQTIAEVMADVRSGDRKKIDEGWSALQYVNNPVLIPHLMELLDLPEAATLILLDNPSVPTDMGHFQPTRPFWASERIREMLWRCLEFSPETKQWAQNLWRQTGDPLRDVLRQWWEQNKEAFARKDYAAVKPLQPVATPTPPAAPKQTTPATDVAPSTAVASPAKPPPSTPAQAESESYVLPVALLITGGVLALVAVGAAVIWQGRRRKAE